MRKVWKAVLVVLGVIAAGSVIVGIVDRKEQKKAEERARVEGREIHKPYGPYEKYFKRPLDFGLSLFALIVLSPVMGITAILVRVKLGSPVLFIQERPGKDERIFKIKKFRTMTDGRDYLGRLLPDIQRLGKLGSFLRKTSLDELPELINIIKGDMSLIGPRPLIPRYLPYFTEAEKHRHDVRPGLSGLAQTSGRNVLSWDERFAYDLEYVSKITFKSDLMITLKTVRKVLKEEDVVTRGTESSVLDFDVERQMKQEDEIIGD